MLEGLPSPPGFDIGPSSEETRFAIATSSARRWPAPSPARGSNAGVTARESGNDAETSRTVEAMSTSRAWPVLLEMDDEGDYPGVLWELAGAMATGAIVSGGKPFTVDESYASSLGCD